MSMRIAINGFGRIGRNIVRAIYEANRSDEFQIVAINDLGSAEANALLLEYDTVHGHFETSVQVSGDTLQIGKDKIQVLHQRDPSQLPWADLDIDVVMECTGLFVDKDSASQHLSAGAKRVLVSAPCKNADATIVFGVNEQTLQADDKIVSNASCTTNCLAPVAQILDAELGIESGLMTTIHAFTGDQNLCDGMHKDPYRARAAGSSMIPSKTGAAAAVGLVLPQLAGKLDGMAVRVPTPNVSLVDLHFIAKRDTSVEEVNALMSAAAEVSPVLNINEKPLVSIDFNHNSASSIYDKNQTRVNGRMVKVMMWYDNEWGFSNRMLDTAGAMHASADSTKAPQESMLASA